MTTLQDKIRGSLIGGAAGDALGYPVEFHTDINEIRGGYGDKGITRYKLMQWVDDGISALETMHNDDGKGCYITIFANYIYDLRDMSHLAADLAASDYTDLKAIDKLGGGWTGGNSLVHCPRLYARTSRIG